MITCNDCRGEIRQGSFIQWHGVQWHFHCFLHRMSCTTFTSMVRNQSGMSATIDQLEIKDAYTLNCWRQQIVTVSEDLLLRCKSAIERDQSNYDNIPKGDAYNNLRHLAKRELLTRDKEMREYIQALNVVQHTQGIEQLLVYGSWLFAHATPLYYLDRGI